MASDYSKYKLYRKYKTEDGVNYTPLDEYQAVYESGDGVDCSCGYREYEYRISEPLEVVCGSEIDGYIEEWVTLTSDFDRSVPLRKFRIDATDPQTSGYYFITFTKSPNYTGSNADITTFSICPDEGTIWDNGTTKRITAQTKIDDNIYEYTFSVPVYFAGAEKNAPLSQVQCYTKSHIISTNQYIKWYKWEYCPDDTSYYEITDEYKVELYEENSCSCGYREYDYEWDGITYMCGNQLNLDMPNGITKTEGDWIVDGNTFTSNDIGDSQVTIERIYFNTINGGIKFTIDQSSENKYDYLVISNLDKEVVSGSPSSTGSSYNYYHHSGRTTGSTSMTVPDNDVHFVELMYRKDGSDTSGRDNVIVTLEMGDYAFDNDAIYEAHQKYAYCPTDATIKEYLDEWKYENPVKDCSCGYREYEWRDTDEVICGGVIEKNPTLYKVEGTLNTLASYYKKQYIGICPTTLVEEIVDEVWSIKTTIGSTWVSTTEHKLGSELGSEYEQDKHYTLWEERDGCEGDIESTEWRLSQIVTKYVNEVKHTELFDEYVDGNEWGEFYIPMGIADGDIDLIIPSHTFCCDLSAGGCKQHCYNLYTLYKIDKDGNKTVESSGRMYRIERTLTENENYSYELYFGDYCNATNTGLGKPVFTYIKKEGTFDYVCKVKYQKYDYQDENEWVEVNYKLLYPYTNDETV